MIRTRTGRRERQVVIDVDTQNHFFLEDSFLCVGDHQQVLANTERILAWARGRHIRTISTIQDAGSRADSFRAGGFSEQKPGGTLGHHRLHLEATDCTDLPVRLMEQYDQVIVYKRCFDPFAEPRAERLLTELESDEFIVLGTPTEGAVKATVLGLLVRGKNVTVVVDATGSLSASRAGKALRKMQAKGARLVCTETFLRRACKVRRLQIAELERSVVGGDVFSC